MANRKRDDVRGEGNKSADRRYRKAAREFEEKGRVGPAADEARRAVEEEEEELEEAEESGRRRSRR